MQDETVTRGNTGLTFRLSDAEVPASAQASTPPSSPLDDRSTQALLDRLPPIAASPADRQSFAWREASVPPPRTGKTVADIFPPAAAPGGPPAVSPGPLTVLRHAPEGQVRLAASVSVTFSQPMVAVSSQSDLAQAAVPVRLTPQPAGAWRWIGTQTLVFDAAPRLPMATDYQVDVAAGTMSAGGTPLATASQWRFSTPAPTLVSSHPSGVVDFNPLLFAAFDQKIEPAAVVRMISVRAGKTITGVRLATPEEVRADEAVRKLAKDTPDGRWLAFRSETSLPPDSAVTVTLAAGTPSAEGPRTTAKPQQWRFRTFGPLLVTGAGCGWRGPCQPLQPWHIVLSHAIDVEKFTDDMVRVEPPLPGMTVSTVHGGRAIDIQGTSKGRTVYHVTLSGLRDVFGQMLRSPATVTFKVGAGEPWLMSAATGRGPIVLDPAAELRFPVYSLNVRTLSVRVHRVVPDDWPAFEELLAAASSPDPMPKLPGRLVFSKTLRVANAAGQVVETNIDLRPALPKGVGQLVVLVEPVPLPPEGGAAWEMPWLARARVFGWVQATHVGLDAFADGKDLVAWASALDDGRPLANVQMSLLPSPRAVATGPDGVARLALDPNSSTLVARLGDDVAMIDSEFRHSLPDPSPEDDVLVWHVFDDRGLYRPGEEVKVKGWIRIRGGGSRGDVRPVNGAVRAVAYRLKARSGGEIAHGSAALNRFGGFDVALTLPPTADLGACELELEADAPEFEDSTAQHVIWVSEFRRPEFEVTAKADGGPYFVRGHAIVSVAASYFAGGGLPNADVRWTVSSDPASFTPPNRTDFSFGQWVPPWLSRSADTEAPRETVHSARTGAAGTHSLRIDFDAVDPPQPTSVTATATVVDVNRQAWTANAGLLVHPASVYVGLRTARYFVERGQPLPVDLIVTDLDGRAVAGRPVTVRAERLQWRQRHGTWREEAVGAEDCSVTSASPDPSRCTFRTTEGGSYRITASVTDTEGRPNQTQIERWVSGGALRMSTEVEQESVTLVPDKDEYRPGEVAEILVMPPFSPAEGLLTIRRSGIVRSERFTIAAASHTLRIPIEERWTPNVFVQVDLVGAAARVNDAGEPSAKLPKRPAFAMGTLQLAVPPVQRTLAVTVGTRERMLHPGDKTTIDVVVKDASGRPVAGGEVAVVVADEAILSMTGYLTPDPLHAFYAPREEGVSDEHLRSRVLLARLPEPGSPPAPPPPVPARLASAMFAPVEGGIAGGVAGGIVGGIRRRADFNPLALFAASLVTDASGHVEIPVTVPDNLTRYRVMAVAATAGVQFGSGESTITTRLPLMVRPSAPRFLNFGDTAEIPVVLQNQTDSAMSVDVAVRASNAQIVGPAGRRVSVPANDRVEVRFPASTVSPGEARFQVAAASGPWTDASEVSVPVRTPATTEAFAAYGQIDGGAVAQRVKAPAEAFTEFGGLDIGTSSTALQSLTDAVLYLVSYPFECAEQISSRVLAVAALEDVLAAFSAPGLPDAAALKARVNGDAQRLAGLQNEDGGFTLWRRGAPSSPYLTVHVVHALVLAKANGFKVPDDALARGRAYLKTIDKRIPARYSPGVRHAVIAYSLYVRNLAGDKDTARARALLREAGLPKLSFEAIGWLLSVLSNDKASAAEVAAIRLYLNNHARDTAAGTHFAVSYKDGDQVLFQSERRADAVVLDALISADPGSDLIAKLVEGLLAHRTAGRWENTQENVFVLLALDRYFKTYEQATPDFVARAWLGGRYAGEQRFKGRTTDRHVVQVPLNALAAAEPADLVLSKEGAGRLYYRVGLQYAPRNLEVRPMDRGFTVERTYSAVDDPGDVRRGADGAWHIRAGARVRVRVSMASPDVRHHVALVDPLPAGVEAIDPALAVMRADAPGGREDRGRQDEGWFRSIAWFEHENLRDDRAEAFSSVLDAGVYTYTYVTRATVPGRFVVPPPRAEEMYHPETFGRGATDRVVVEPR